MRFFRDELPYTQKSQENKREGWWHHIRHPLYLSQSVSHSQLAVASHAGCKVFLVGRGECDGDSGETLWPASVEALLALPGLPWIVNRFSLLKQQYPDRRIDTWRGISNELNLLFENHDSLYPIFGNQLSPKAILALLVVSDDVWGGRRRRLLHSLWWHHFYAVSLMESLIAKNRSGSGGGEGGFVRQ